MVISFAAFENCRLRRLQSGVRGRGGGWMAWLRCGWGRTPWFASYSHMELCSSLIWYDIVLRGKSREENGRKSRGEVGVMTKQLLRSVGEMSRTFEWQFYESCIDIAGLGLGSRHFCQPSNPLLNPQSTTATIQTNRQISDTTQPQHHILSIVL